MLSLDKSNIQLQNTFLGQISNLKSDVLDTLNRCSVQVLVVLSGFDEEMGLDVSLHLVDAGDEVVVPSVHLVLPPGPGGVGDAGAEPVRELPHQVVVDPVLHRAEDDDRSGELEVDLLHRLVGEDLTVSSLLPASYRNILLNFRLAWTTGLT